MDCVMKIALLVYHSNIQNLYPKEWIDDFRESIIGQTHKDFAILEMNYGGNNYQIFENSVFESVKMPTFVHALNYLLDKCFASGYSFAFNTNVDDIYSYNRIEKQLPYLQAGFDIVSANFSLFEGNRIIKAHSFHNMDIAQQLSNNHNIIAHPLVGYSKGFWERNRYVPEQMPLEDMMLWQRGIKNSKFIILQDNLLLHRIHSNAVCRSDNK